MMVMTNEWKQCERLLAAQPKITRQERKCQVHRRYK